MQVSLGNEGYVQLHAHPRKQRHNENFQKIDGRLLTILELIGHGGFGFVKKAKHMVLGEVAVKQLKAPLDQYILPDPGKSTRQKLEREARRHAEFVHNNVIRLLGVVMDPDCYALVLEYAPNGTLSDLLRIVPQMSWSVKRWLLKGIAEGMKYLHTPSRSIIHRDLKSENVLLSETLEPKISDFGLSEWHSFSKHLSSEPKNETRRAGTVAYICPESWRDINLPPNRKFDVYAFGILIWEVITEKIPYENVRDVHILEHAVLKGQRPNLYEFPNDVPQNLKTLMEQCWHQNQDSRPTFDEISTLLSSQCSDNDITKELEKVLEKKRKMLSTEYLEPNHNLRSASLDGYVRVGVQNSVADKDALPCSSLFSFRSSCSSSASLTNTSRSRSFENLSRKADKKTAVRNAYDYGSRMHDVHGNHDALVTSPKVFFKGKSLTYEKLLEPEPRLVKWKQNSMMGYLGNRSLHYMVCQYSTVEGSSRCPVKVFVQKSYCIQGQCPPILRVGKDCVVQYGHCEGDFFLAYHEPEHSPYQHRFGKLPKKDRFNFLGIPLNFLWIKGCYLEDF